MGNLSNDDVDGTRTAKSDRFISKTTTLYLHHAFFVHFLAVTARLYLRARIME